MTTPDQLVEHFFRHEYGRVVSILCSQFGTRHLETIEDVVQSALQKAMLNWARQGVPDDPSGWIFRVSRNGLLDLLRREKTWKSIQQDLSHQSPSASSFPERKENAIEDELLRMLFLCCHDEVPPESQIALALKTLCGFSVREISFALLTTEANVQKRLTRARERLREVQFDIQSLSQQDIRNRVHSVETILYLIFNEGYSAHHPSELIRADLCHEAIRLTALLLQPQEWALPSTEALFALMHLHAARLSSRIGSAGQMLILEEQDRSAWNQELISRGLAWLSKAARGNEISKYHLEAAIAAEHCQALDFAQTNWQRIHDCYQLLHRLEPSFVHALNLAIAMAYLHGPRPAIKWLLSEHPTAPTSYYHWHASLGELHRRVGDHSTARNFFEQALQGNPSAAEQELIRRRLSSLDHHLSE